MSKRDQDKAVRHMREQPGRAQRWRRSSTAPTSERNARKPPAKMYRIGEIVDYAGVSRQTIHNYTTMGLITEAKRTSGGHRLYDESVFRRLELIAMMKRQSRSMREIRDHFDRLDGRK